MPQKSQDTFIMRRMWSRSKCSGSVMGRIRRLADTGRTRRIKKKWLALQTTTRRRG
ncbi:unnamed protein product [Caenorhabditis brenneri]